MKYTGIAQGKRNTVSLKKKIYKESLILEVYSSRKKEHQVKIKDPQGIIITLSNGKRKTASLKKICKESLLLEVYSSRKQEHASL